MKKQKGLFRSLLLFCLLCFIKAEAYDLEKLSKDSYWRILLHIKEQKSEIDDPRFFLSSKGHKDPKAELSALVGEIQRGNREIFCRFPARIAFVKAHIPSLFKELNSTCQPLKELLSESSYTISLIFPTAHVNSPASMFGHTFLRLDQDKKTPLLSHAINYAAKTDESNGFIFAYKGLFGGYRGAYSMLPYYKKIKEYNHMEKRDIWEYDLVLSPQEVRRLITHLYELREIESRYYFFLQNCSYNLLWLLEAATKDPSLMDSFSYKAIPIDTIRLLQQKGLIEKVVYRPSVQKRMRRLIERIKEPHKGLLFLETYDLTLLEELNQKEQIALLELAVERLKSERSQKKISKKNYVKRLMKLLRKRSLLPKGEPLPLDKGVDPLKGHKSARVGFGYGEGGLFFSLRPAFHDIYDLDRGFAPGAYIDFFKLEVERSKLKRLDLISLSSYALWDRFDRDISWNVKFSIEPLFDQSLYFHAAFGGGFAFVDRQKLFYLTLTSKLYMGKNSKSALSPKLGMAYNRGRFKVGVAYERDYFASKERSVHSEGFMTYELDTDIALNLKLYEDKIEQKREGGVFLRLFYYF